HFVLVSMAAGVKISTICENLGFNAPVIRIMPNTPAEVSKGMILYTYNKQVTDADIKNFLAAFKSAGELDEIPEALIDAASAVSGCGPAFAYMFIEALSEGGIKCGLEHQKALKYAAATVEGAAKMVLETNQHPAKLKDAVCSPAGSTIEGVKTLEAGNLKGLTIDAVSASFKRTIELGKSK
ncbi:MAG: pyrroline-5-carboxylate reductase, partial [Clostridia bacterium]|nr:pyrroline-5-carboxylate reductase [Clostridia bacterium]